MFLTFFERLVESSDLDEDKAQPVCHALVRMFVRDGAFEDGLEEASEEIDVALGAE